MSHEMMKNDTMMSGSNIVPWHRHPGSTTIKGRANAHEVLKLAGIDWKVKKVPLMLADNSQIILPDNVATVREDDNTILGVVGSKYTVLQNEDALKVFEAVAEKGDAIFETAGSLFGGKKVYISALIDGLIRVGKGDDVSKKYLLWANAHDGTAAGSLRLTTVRVVCNNTYTAALRENGRHVSIRHTGNAEKMMEEATALLGIANKRFLDMEAAYNEMLKIQVSKEELREYLTKCFKKVAPVSTDKQEKTQEEDAKEKVARAIPKIEDLFETGNHFPEDAGSLYRAFQSLTEWTNHHRTSKEQARSLNTKQDNELNSILFGQSADLNQIAFKEAVKMIGGSEARKMADAEANMVVVGRKRK